MSSNITNISHGQTNWDTVVNQNFENLDSDSGWVSITLLAPFKGELYVRKTAHLIEVCGYFISTEEITTASGTPVAKIPDGLDKYRYFTALSDGLKSFARLTILADGTLSFLDSTQDITSNSVYLANTFII